MKKKKQVKIYNKDAGKLPINECLSYLVGLGIPNLVAYGIVAKYPLDDIMDACLIMKANDVNITHRADYLLGVLEDGNDNTH